MSAPFDNTAVIPVLTIERVADAVSLATALAEGGLTVLEVTMRTADALAAIEAIARALPEVMVGAGTVLRPADIAAAQNAGAKFLVSPGLTPELAAAGTASGLPYLPGTATATEVMLARDFGFTFLKFFPAAESGGIGMLRAFAPVFAGIKFCPTGGVTPDNARDYLALPNVPVVGGSWMAPRDLIAAHDWDTITKRARAASNLKNPL